jgi:RQC domain
MSRRVQRVAYHLDTKGIRFLPPAEVRMILRGADDLIRRGGRHLLTLILKGSRAKEVLTRSLDLSPAHGFYKNLSAEEVLARVDWVIRQGYLAIEYDYRLPLLVYTPKGWSIEKETMADEHLRHIDQALRSSRQPPDMSDLKDRNREVIWRLLEKIEASGDLRYIPALEAWEPIDYRKVRARIRSVIRSLRGENAGPDAIVDPLARSAHERKEDPQA